MTGRRWRSTSSGAAVGVAGDRTAVLTNVLNPKLTIFFFFFFAFLPQFVHSGNQAATGHLLGLSLVFMAVTFVVFTVYGYFAAGMRRYVLGRPKVVAFGFK